MTLRHAFSSPVADATGTLTVWAGSSTATVAASQMVLPSNWNSAHDQTLALAGNTAGVSSISGTNFFLAGGNNVTLSGIQGANVGTVSISAGAAGGLAVSADGSSISAGTAVFSNSNNVSFGMNGSTVTASATVATSLSNIRVSAGTTSDLLSAVTFSNSNGISFGIDASTITASHNALTSQSNQALSAANGSFAFQTASFSNVNGVSFATAAGSAIQASVETSYVRPGFTSTTTAGTAVVGTLSTNGLSMGVPAFLTTARGSTDAVGLNTAQTNVTWTVNSSGISLNAAGYAGTGTTFNGANVSGSITQNSAGLQLSLSANAGGGGQQVFFTQFLPVVGNLTITNAAIAQNTLVFYPFDIYSSIAASALALPVLLTNSSTGSSSGQVGLTIQIGIYTQGTNTTRIDSHYSTTYTLAASNSSNDSRAVTWIDGIVNSTSYSTDSSSSAGINLSSLFHGVREFQLPWETTLAPSRYWFAVVASTSLAGTSNGVLSVNLQVWRLGTHMGMNSMGRATNNSSISGGQQMLGLGFYSVTTGGFPASIGFSELRSENVNYFPVAQIRRSYY